MKELFLLGLLSMFLTAACDEESGPHYYDSSYTQVEAADDGSPIVEQWTMTTYLASGVCEESHDVAGRDHSYNADATGPYFYIIVYYRDGSTEGLLGAHQLYTEYAADPDYPDLRQGFFARYKRCLEDQDCSDVIPDDDDPVAESGTVTVSQGEGGLVMDYDIVFAADIHETGRWVLEQCGTAYQEDF
jgi:hypothetical protein